MSTHQVPGEVPSHEAQLKSLRDTLAGNKAFSRVRGLLGKSTVDLMRECGNGTSRVSAKNDWAELASALAVMQTLLARYHRDSWAVAEDELVKALRNPRYRVTGETIPLEKTGPYTLVVINPEETFTLLKWMQEFDNENSANMHAAIGSVVYEGELFDPVRKRMVERARECREHVKVGGMHALLSIFSERLHKVPCTAVTSAGASFYPVSLTHFLPPDQRRVYYDDQLHERQGSTDWARAKVATITRPVPKATFALGFPEEQSTILSAFSREVQCALVGSWQFRYPRATHNLGGAHKGFSVGFHPEAEHARWKNERPQFASLGISQGWGAILLPNSEPGVESWYSDEAPHLVLRRFIRRAKGNRW